MRTLFTFLSAFIVIIILYTLFIITAKQENNEHQPLSGAVNSISPLKIKMSIGQIDSLSANENYGFTIGNYYRDVVYTKSADIKSKRI
jgi:hypothetical protein